MFYSLLIRHVDDASCFIDPSYMRLTPKTISKNGVVGRVFGFESFNPSNELSKFNVSDFKLENVLAVGAYDMLKPVSLTDCNPLSVIDKFETDLSNSLKLISDVQEKTS